MTRYHNHAGFQISNKLLRLVEVKNKSKHFVLENIDEEYFGEFFKFGDKETKLITILQDTFDKLILRNPLSSNSVSFTLPSNVFNMFQIPYDDALTKRDLEEHINWELSVLLPEQNINDLAIQTIKINNSKLREGSFLILLTLPKNWIQLLNKFCTRNNVVLKFIDNEHLSANNLLYLQNYLLENKLYITVLIRENYISVILLEKNLPVHINISSYDNSNDIVEVLTNELDKISKKFEEVIEIEQSFVFGEPLPEMILKNIRENTGLKLISVDPFLNIKKSEKVTEKKEFIENSSIFSTAAGIAYRLV